MTSLGRILIVDDDAALCRAVTRLLSKLAPSWLVSSCNDYAAAQERVANASYGWTGFIFDVRLDASREPHGVELLELVRRTAYRRTPAVVMTDHNDNAVARRVARANGLFAPKPLQVEDVNAFLTRAAVREAGLHGALAEAVEEVSRAFGLSATQGKVLAANLRHEHPAEIAAALRIAPHTYKDHLQAIRERLGVTSIREACQVVWTRAGEQPPSVPSRGEPL